MAFKPSSDKHKELSVDIEKLMLEEGVDPQQYVTTPRWTGSVYLLIGEVRTLEFQVGYDPLEENRYHGGVWGQFTRGRIRELSRRADWFVALDGVSITID